jgi:hypothetical protein
MTILPANKKIVTSMCCPLLAPFLIQFSGSKRAEDALKVGCKNKNKTKLVVFCQQHQGHFN